MNLPPNDSFPSEMTAVLYEAAGAILQ